MTDAQNAAVTALFEGLKDYDGDVLKTLFTEDATIIQPQRPAYHGAQGIAQMVADLSRTYTDWTPQPVRTVAQDNVIAVEWTATVTDFGGGQSRVDGCSVLDFQGDKIHRMRSYWRPEDMHG